MAGYPMGGDSLSITKGASSAWLSVCNRKRFQNELRWICLLPGIVSRVTMARYAHASNKLLGIQIDAAVSVKSMPVAALISVGEIEPSP